MKLSEMTTYECAKALTHDEYANWTRSGAFALVEYLEQMEEDCGTQIEFDPVALRCEYSEYTDLLGWAYEYWGTGEWKDELGFNIDEEIDEDEAKEAISIYIKDHGQLIEFDGGVIVSNF